MCNYISKLISPLQNEFIKLRFNNLNYNDILHFLQDINKKKEINLQKMLFTILLQLMVRIYAA